MYKNDVVTKASFKSKMDPTWQRVLYPSVKQVVATIVWVDLLLGPLLLQIFIKSQSSGLAIQKGRERDVDADDNMCCCCCNVCRRSGPKILDFRSHRVRHPPHRQPPFCFFKRGECDLSPKSRKSNRSVACGRPSHRPSTH